MPIKILKKTENPMASERFYQQRREALIDSGIPANMIDKFNATPNKLDASRILKKRKEKFKKAENPMADERFNAAFRSRMKKAGLKDSEIGDTRFKAGGLSGGQAKLAAKAPPPNKIDSKDFAVLRKEKAKGRGMGLQDEKLKPGKVQKAFLGKMIKGAGKSIGRLFGAKKSATATPGTVTMSKSGIGGEGGMLPQLLQKAIDDEIIKPASKGRMMKAKKGKMFDGYLSTFDASAEASTPKSQRGVTTIVGVKPGAEIGKGKKRFTSMEAMRTAKGFRTIDGKQETSSQFNKRRMELAVPKDIANKALKATRIGKIALGIGAAGVAASQYLKSKMKKDEPKKKMVGGMAKKYSVGGGMMNKPMGYSSGSKLMDFIKSGSYTDKYGTKTNVDKAIKKINLSPKDKDLATMKPASDKKMMGGGMMQRPMGYKHGTKPGAGPLGAAGLRQPTKENIDQIIKDQKFPPISVYTEDKKKQQKPFPVPSLYNNNKKPSAGRIREDEPRAKKKPSNIFGYKSGTMVKARGCKLGRTRPTKMY
jgi:hypothetical protein